MYMTLFRSPADREQIKRVGQRMFPKQNDQFMSIYRLETEKPYGYIFIDNKPETMAGHQVLSNLFGKTLRYDIGEVMNRGCMQDQDQLIQEPIIEETTDCTADTNNFAIASDDLSPNEEICSNEWDETTNDLARKSNQIPISLERKIKKRKKKSRFKKLSHRKTLQYDDRSFHPRAPSLHGGGFGGSGLRNRGIVLLDK